MKNLLIFFDNQAFKLNNIIINYIKRWIVYKIINNINEYKCIYIHKTYPEFNEKIIEINGSNSFGFVDEILMCLNNVIYKKIDNYATICFKNIIDKISTYESFNAYTNEILIISSLESNVFTEGNIDFINTKINETKFKINLINIFGTEIFKNIFPSLNEITVDVNCLKIENIGLHKIFESDSSNNFEKIKKYSNLNIKCLDKFEYLKLLYYIESLLLNNLCVNNFSPSTEQNEIIVSIINNVSINGIENYNQQLQNIFKSYKNTIKDILNRHSNLLIKFPIDKLSPELSTSYIKYVLEFYSIIYPKINYYKSLNASDKIQKNKQKNIFESTSEIKINNIKNMEIEPEDISCEYLTSSLTITNWKEEYDNANPFGFLIKYNPNKLSYKGIFDLNSSILKTYPNMIVNNVTTNFVPLYDYYQIILFDYEKKDNDGNENEASNDNEKKTFNISQFSIPDNIHGDGNVLLPIYINKNHWELTKSLWSYHLSFINNCFEQEYNVKMDNIYFLTILKFLNNLKNINDKNNVKLMIRLFGYLLRTCIQILIDNKFMHSIKNDYKKYLDCVLNLDTLEKNSTFSDLMVRIIQLIISNGIDYSELETDLNKITTFIFKKYIISNYKMDFWDKINNPNCSNELKKIELEQLSNNVIQENICWLYLEFDLKLFNKIIKSIYSLNGFNQFVKQIDKTNGCLEDMGGENKIINLGTIKEIIDLKSAEQFDIKYYYQFIDISKYCEMEI